MSEKRMLSVAACKHKRICLIDVDSSIPNLALMKISAYFKKAGFHIDLMKLNYSGYDHQKREKKIIDCQNYDKVFISTLFTLNRDVVKVINCKNIHKGGTGYKNFRKNLPKDIEHLFPDYSIYPENEYSLGFLTRGCIRNCAFCFIPKKEGKLRLHSPLEEFYNPKLPKIMLLDNNFLACPEAIDLLKQLKTTGKRITFKQGLDFRLLTPEKAKYLTDLNYDGEFIFAFDRIQDKPVIERNLKMWRQYVVDWKTKFFVLVGFDSKLSEDLERIYFLKKHKCLAYVMRHTNCYSSPNRPLYTDLASWCNQPGLFKNMTFKQFLKKRHATKERYEQTMKIIRKNKLKI